MPDQKLCITLTPETLDDLFSADIDGADCVEVRIDYLKDPHQSIDVHWGRFPVPVIATCRGKERGGLFAGSIDEEIHILERAAQNGARFVDIDFRYARSIPSAKVIASYHNFEETPGDLETIVGKLFSSDAQIAKVAVQVNRWADNRRLLDLLARDNPKPLIVAGMGDIGQITRIVGPSRGSYLTFSASSRQAAPGQLTIAEMLNTYHFRRIKKSTKVLGVLGMPVGHSLSPGLHNPAFAAAGLDMVYVKLPAPDIKDFAENARAIGISGFSVTIPHKMAVMPYLSRMSPAAEAVGAVNTVSDENGNWIGDNTDVHGVEAALKSVGFDPRGKKVVIMGKGGGAKAAVTAVSGAREITVLSRVEISGAGRMPCDLLINATPVGMHPNVDSSPVERLISADVVFDMIYNPVETALLQNAKAQGKVTVGGTAMFLAQATRQFEIWTGRPAPEGTYSHL